MANAIIMGGKGESNYITVLSKIIEANNKVANGHFVNGTTSWTMWNTNATSTVSNKVLTIVENLTTVSDTGIRQAISASLNDKLFLYFNYQTTAGLSVTSDSTYHYDLPAYADKNTFGGIFTATSSNIFSVRAYTSVLTVSLSNIYCLNMTTLGIADYTTAQMLELVNQAKTYWNTVN